MEGCFLEISECIDVDAWVVDESADDLDGRVHGCIVERRPCTLVSVVDIDGQL